MIPDYVILDAQMIAGLPASIVAATGVDALAHVVECYTSKKATPLSDTYAAAGAKLIFRNIEQAYKNPSDMEAKNNLLLGAFYGGRGHHRKRYHRGSRPELSPGRQVPHPPRRVQRHTVCPRDGVQQGCLAQNGWRSSATRCTRNSRRGAGRKRRIT